jgi:uncharacterized protein YndB with AHSA1/START domain
MPGHVSIDTVVFQEEPGERTKMITTSLFHAAAERDGMLSAGMEGGLTESHGRLAELLAADA